METWSSLLRQARAAAGLSRGSLVQRAASLPTDAARHVTLDEMEKEKTSIP